MKTKKLEKVHGRSIPGFDLHDALMKCKDSLVSFGGHSMAVGVSINKNKFKIFKDEFLEIAKNEKVSEFVPILNIDKVLDLDNINRDIVESLSLLEPFGEGNKIPVFAFKNLIIYSIRSLSDGKHLKIVLKNNNNTYIDAIGFNLGHLSQEFKIGDRVDIAGNLEINSFNGVDNIQINLKDLIKAI